VLAAAHPDQRAAVMAKVEHAVRRPMVAIVMNAWIRGEWLERLSHPKYR